MIEIIFVIVLIFLLIKIWLNRYSNTSDKIFFSLFVSTVAFAMLALVGPVAVFYSVEIKRDDCSAPIYSLRNQTGIEGSFTFGCGYVNNFEYYYMFQDNGKGGFYRIQLNANDCIIYQKNEPPHLFWQNITYRLPKWFVVWPVLCKKNNTKYDVIVPTNTIIQRFNLN